MELREFINKSLCEIVNGIYDARKELKDNNVDIVPDNLKSQNQAVYNSDRGYVSIIDFEVLISASDSSSLNGGIKVISGVINGGIKSILKSDIKETNKIKFSIPIVFGASNYSETSL